MSGNLRTQIEVIGITAVVASLIAVVIELRQTQSALIASTYQARALDAIAQEHFIAESEHLLPILVDTDDGQNVDAIADLNDSDRTRLSHFLQSRLIDTDNEFYQYQNGFLDAGFFEGTTSEVAQTWAPRWRAMGLKETRQDFREYIDGLLEED